MIYFARDDAIFVVLNYQRNMYGFLDSVCVCVWSEDDNYVVRQTKALQTHNIGRIPHSRAHVFFNDIFPAAMYHRWRVSDCRDNVVFMGGIALSRAYIMRC